jgi:hypothetical protein
MRAEISDYALLGDTRTAALVSQDGSMPLPGKPGPDSTARRIVRLVIGRGGRVPMRMESALRFGYGPRKPVLDWARQDLLAADGHDTLRLCTPAGLKTERARPAPRSCWLRDPALTLNVFRDCGYPQEALAWRDWLLRAVASGPGGEWDLPEQEVSWLPEHHGASPVRVGNAAASQFQMDVYSEIADAQCALVLGNGFAKWPAAGGPPGPGRPRTGLAEARRGDLGDPGPAPALHLLQGDGLDRVRPGGQAGQARRAGRPAPPLACAAR